MSIVKSRDNSETRTKRVSQWEDLMRKFSEAHGSQCKSLSLDIPRAQRSVKQFPTRSSYEGTWDILGMSGYGVYKFPNDVIYEGEFYDGMFHGEGELIYPGGERLRGKWKKGNLMERKLVFADGLEYSETDWNYCRFPDRRFTIEYDKGLKPGGKSYLTAEQPTRPVPEGYYDTGDGFYDPKTKMIYNVDDLTEIVSNKKDNIARASKIRGFWVLPSMTLSTLKTRSPSVREQKWIIENCRTSPDAPLGPRKDLYEEWSQPQPILPVPPRPASPTKASETRTKITVPQDTEIEVAFQNLVMDETESSSSSS